MVHLRQQIYILTPPRLSPDPNLLVCFTTRSLGILGIPKLDFPHPQLILGAVRHASMHVKGPPMLRARHPRAKDHPKVLNVKRRPLRKGVGRVGTSLQSHIRTGDG